MRSRAASTRVRNTRTRSAPASAFVERREAAFFVARQDEQQIRETVEVAQDLPVGEQLLSRERRASPFRAPHDRAREVDRGAPRILARDDELRRHRETSFVLVDQLLE